MIYLIFICPGKFYIFNSFNWKLAAVNVIKQCNSQKLFLTYLLTTLEYFNINVVQNNKVIAIAYLHNEFSGRLVLQ